MKKQTAARFRALAFAACLAVPLLSGRTVAAADDQNTFSFGDRVITETTASIARWKEYLQRTGKGNEEIRGFETALENFIPWNNAVSSMDYFQRRFEAGQVVAFSGRIGELRYGDQYGLPVGTYAYDFLDAGANPRGVLVFFGTSQVPEGSEFCYVIGSVMSRDEASNQHPEAVVVNADMFRSVTKREYGDRRAALQKSVPSGRTPYSEEELYAGIAQGQMDDMLGQYAKSLGLPPPDPEPPWPPRILPYIIGGVVLFLVLVVLLVLLLRGGKKPPKCPRCGSPLNPDGFCPRGCNRPQPTCSRCGSPLNPDGTCPRCSQPPPARCPRCGSPLNPDGTCPRGCGNPPPPPPPPGKCPSCGSPLNPDGSCPRGCTVPLCSHCGTPLRDGECPNGCEECPTCGSLLVNGMCPNGHTILRCPECGKILRDGECPKGHGAKPLSLGGSDGSMAMSPFSLEVVEAPVPHRHDRCELPETVVIGRDFREATGAYIQLRFADAAQRQSCSRTYVKLAYLADKNAVRVTLIASNANQFAIVNGRRLSRKGDAAEMSEGGVLELNPRYRLKLVRA